MTDRPESMPTLECDLIMKGGITSGVVYPRAAAHLSQRYRFRNLGGASAGAIAAVFVAAAEYGRGSGGFDRLNELPTELGGNLKTLFQPSASTAPLHVALITLVDSDVGAWRKTARLIRVVVRSAWLAVLVVLLLGSALGITITALVDRLNGGSVGWVNATRLLVWWVVPLLIIALVVGAWRTLRSALRAAADNGFGLCDGHSTLGPVPLTDWMHEKLNETAGLDPSAAPLTFGDLWGSDGVEDFDRVVPLGKSELDLAPLDRRWMRRRRAINLEVMTTNLTMRRPFRIPFETQAFLYCETCLDRYFPEAVMKHFAVHAPKASATRVITFPDGTTREISMRCPRHPETMVRPLPRTPNLPLVFAARMSLSFPGLISAVPLAYIDYSRTTEHVEVITAWFSDGGIASNFPMHLFDSMMPTRPTFGFDLQPLTLEHDDERLVCIPERKSVRSHAIVGLNGFAKAVLGTMQNWSDITQLSMNAFRERVAEIRLSDVEGGMNLAMAEDTIGRLADRGREAATLLDDFNLAEHQLKRAQMALQSLDDLVVGMLHAADQGLGVVIDLLNDERRDAAHAVLGVWREWEESHPLSSGTAPRLQADFRITPRQ